MAKKKTAIKKEPTWQQTAFELGVNVQWLIAHRKKSGSPGDSKDLEKWREYIKRNNALRRGGAQLPVESGVDSSASQEKHYTAEEVINLRARLTDFQGRYEEQKCRLKEIEIERERKNLVPADEAKKVIADVLVPLRRRLETMPRNVAKRANPLDPNLAERAIQEAIDHIFRNVSKGK